MPVHTFDLKNNHNAAYVNTTFIGRAKMLISGKTVAPPDLTVFNCKIVMDEWKI